jgi:peptidoglycan hydrolase-like protein with peptidoglycan-binding domain
MAGNAGNSMSSNDMTPATPPSHRTIRQAQAKLKQAADYPGKIDGAWGPMTESGVRKWQQAHNLNASGQLDAATLQSLNIQPSGHASNQRTSSQGTIGGQTSSNT